MQSKNVIFAASCLVFSIVFTVLLLLSPTGVQATSNGQETCPNTDSEWVKVDSLTGKTYDYTAPAGKLVTKVCYKSSTDVINYDVVPPVSSLTVSSTVENKNGQIQDISHASFKLIDEPNEEEEENHDLVLTSMCIDQKKEVRRWRVFHKDSSDEYFPIKLGYKIYPGNLTEIDALFGFNHTLSTRFTDPYFFETPYNGEDQTVKLYWWKTSNEGWVEDDTKAANNNFCEEEYVECSKTVLKEGTWSSWGKDPQDPTKEIRTKTDLYNDSKNSEKLCSTKVYTESRSIEKPVEEDEPSVLGTTTTSTTTVVHAPTAGEDNVLIYFIEIALITLTSISLVHIAKDYLNRN